MPEAKTIVRSRRCGVKDLYIAKVTANNPTTYTAGKPEKLARAVKVAITDKYTSEKIYSDDGTEEVVTSYEGTDVEIEVNTLAPTDRQALWAHLEANGYLLEAAEDNPAELALGYRTRQLNGKYEFVWLYCGKFDQGNAEEYETIAEKKNHKSATAKASFYERQKVDKINDAATGQPSEKHLYRVRVDESNLIGENTDAKAAIGAWFNEVQEPKPASLPASASAEQAGKH